MAADVLMCGGGNAELTPEEERVLIRDIALASEANTKDGDTFYLLTQRWWQHWIEYVNQDQSNNMNDGPSLSENCDSAGSTALKRPSVIDNSNLIYDSASEESSAGFEIHDTLLEGRDYVLLPYEVWNQLYVWYGGGPTLPRKVISSGLSQTELTVEVYPLRLHLLLMSKGDRTTLRISKKETVGDLHRRACEIFDLNSEQVCIWDYYGHRKHALMNDMNRTLDDANVQMDQDILVEIINTTNGSVLGGSMIQGNGFLGKENAFAAAEPPKLNPSTVGNLSASRASSRSFSADLAQSQSLTPGVRELENTASVSGVSTRGSSGGLTGLINLGNTCFMNSAIQCLVHTPEFAKYFREDYHQEINWQNPLGMVGELALAFGELLRKLWAPGRTPIAPRPFKAKLARFAPQFSGYNQHDSQELLAFLLDGLHEDLNRVKHKPYIKSRDADGRPDEEVADEYWANHIARNDSIIVNVCQGQYKSTLVCPVCNKISVTFDPFMYLSLPLQSTTTRTMTVTVFSCDGTALPSSYTVTVPKQGRCRDLIQALSVACSLQHTEKLLLAEVRNHQIQRMMDDALILLSTIKDDDHLAAYKVSKYEKNEIYLQPRAVAEDRMSIVEVNCRIILNLLGTVPSAKINDKQVKSLILWRLPEVLVIHLKRFSYSRSMKHKLETFVNFPIHDFDLTNYVANKNNSRRQLYELYALTNHYGGMGSGHYTAHIKLLDENRWYNFDDSHISPINEDDVKSAAAYVLFYRRVKIGDSSVSNGTRSGAHYHEP
ncbi:hypothetical protein EUGRSUZ_A02196 [Eucalyptus grandis]|uniref:Uncharacterized protein n=1 Tax=Eucalyptus grandis TaxID=71139 RepID=A0ACC3M5B3_EUCGR|nr:hypothetical protein EUGRSUZ_A02196 [Eucalyptus grandis]